MGKTKFLTREQFIGGKKKAGKQRIRVKDQPLAYLDQPDQPTIQSSGSGNDWR